LPSAFEREYKTYLTHKDDKDFAGNETQVRTSLVAPFFRDALGWNIEDPDEIKYENHIATKRADIITYVDGLSQFVVEVKSLTRDVFDNPEFYKQAIQYADHLERKYAILTNFHEFVILRTDLERLHKAGKVDKVKQGQPYLYWWKKL
jgi:predicted type IV restriction endonuclease